jgi:serine/threonine protein kinase
MDVVYQALQYGLNRTVALKMVLAGAHARSDELVRFLAEAETAARLQHHGIVQVFDSTGTAVAHLWDLRLIRRQLREMNLDWDPPLD